MACAWVKVTTKEDKELGNTHCHEGLLVCVVQYGVLPQTASALPQAVVASLLHMTVGEQRTALYMLTNHY